MLKDIIEVNHQKKHLLYLKFEDGKEGIVDISQLIECTGIFAKLQDINYFKTVKLNLEWGTIYWENDADLETSPPTPLLLLRGEKFPPSLPPLSKGSRGDSCGVGGLGSSTHILIRISVAKSV
ncbi:MAG: DUF2442 domain-containing protein [Okeania sp. SIO3I5]|uniref:DUF2442 domain-containing protein n=1 Tax=Okeania sp. SIO3I5 TaxID=2607805 RepID=UPI0013B728D5|nr:DUF2442 domain-containing protein [Okeania sp. SIO3I5]NEQ35771.1 DUF2442 domain-containing protein [Okeania sp. SIO3I5]